MKSLTLALGLTILAATVPSHAQFYNEDKEFVQNERSTRNRVAGSIRGLRQQGKTDAEIIKIFEATDEAGLYAATVSGGNLDLVLEQAEREQRREAAQKDLERARLTYAKCKRDYPALAAELDKVREKYVRLAPGLPVRFQGAQQALRGVPADSSGFRQCLSAWKEYSKVMIRVSPGDWDYAQTLQVIVDKTTEELDKRDERIKNSRLKAGVQAFKDKFNRVYDVLTTPIDSGSDSPDSAR